MDWQKIYCYIKMSYLPPYSHSKSKIEVKLPSTANVATENRIATVENRISNVSGLVKKADYNAERNERY